LEPYHADIVVLQECAENLADAQYWPRGWTVRFEQSLCLASRFPVVEAKTLERIETGDQGGTGNVMFYRLRSDSAWGMLDLAVLHLETPRKGIEQVRYGARVSALARNELVREVGSRRMSRWISEQSDSALIAGDFNLPVESRIFRAHWSACGDAFSAVGHGFGWTRVLPHFAIRIDHVLTCAGWRAVHTELGPELGSDHLPLIVDLARVR